MEATVQQTQTKTPQTPSATLTVILTTPEGKTHELEIRPGRDVFMSRDDEATCKAYAWSGVPESERMESEEIMSTEEEARFSRVFREVSETVMGCLA